MEAQLSTRHNSMSEAFLSSVEYLDSHELKKHPQYTVGVSKYPLGDTTLHVYRARHNLKEVLSVVFVKFIPLNDAIEIMFFDPEHLALCEKLLFPKGGISMEAFNRLMIPNTTYRVEGNFLLTMPDLARQTLCHLREGILNHEEAQKVEA